MATSNGCYDLRMRTAAGEGLPNDDVRVHVRSSSYIPPLFEWCGCHVGVERVGRTCSDSEPSSSAIDTVIEVELIDEELHPVFRPSAFPFPLSTFQNPTVSLNQDPLSAADFLRRRVEPAAVPDRTVPMSTSQHWSSFIRPARDRYEQNVEMTFNAGGKVVDEVTQGISWNSHQTISSCVVRLRTTRAIRPGEELTVWYGDLVGRLIGVPALAFFNIRGSQCYACTHCPTYFRYPNPLKSHLMYSGHAINGDVFQHAAVNGRFPQQHPPTSSADTASRSYCRADIPAAAAAAAAMRCTMPLLSPQTAWNFNEQRLGQLPQPTAKLWRSFDDAESKPTPNATEADCCELSASNERASKSQLAAMMLLRGRPLDTSCCIYEQFADHCPSSERPWTAFDRGGRSLTEPKQSHPVSRPEQLPSDTRVAEPTAHKMTQFHRRKYFESSRNDSSPLAKTTIAVAKETASLKPSKSISRRVSTSSSISSSVSSSACSSPASADRRTSNQKRQGAMTHRCIHCDKMYSRRYGLTIHLRTHSGDKPLECPVCQRAFGDPSNLNKHVRLHAAAAATSVVGVRGNGTAAALQAIRESPYRCRHCGKVLVRRRDLERHIRSRHPGVLDSDAVDVSVNEDFGQRRPGASDGVVKRAG